MRKFALVATVALVGAGCYHATIETGSPPSTQIIHKAFASGWIYGLVPPSTVSTAAQCPNGVAKVEAQLSFLNQLVSFLTLYIYTPMQIDVTCAEKMHADNATAIPTMTVGQARGDRAIRDTFTAAAERAVATRAPVYVEVTTQQR